MALKFFVLAALATLCRGGVIGAPGALVASPVLARISDDTFDPNPAYSFAYDVQDALTGDSKGQVESRANGIVQGQYNVAEPDGTRRIVDYVADPVNGFNAVVRKAPLAYAAAPVVAKAVLPAPAAPLAVAPALRAASPYYAVY
ncbi:cuticle protein-like [Anoplophora glabripennis]|uniref:cuticle protein-like n=1 Tax=Anoplophora glabripennis TaxID=217634 RepID=UPI0008743D53|nr:cuticle protein-like [Anoplophora glabripennis]